MFKNGYYKRKIKNNKLIFKLWTKYYNNKTKKSMKEKQKENIIYLTIVRIKKIYV